MATIDLHPDIVRAIREFEGTKLGRKYDKFARKRYGVSGGILLGKTNAGEAGGRSTKSGPIVSSAGARGPYQFMPGTRQEMIDKYGLDPYKNDRQAVRAAARYQMERGVEGYNPGMPTYKDYILGQKLNKSDRRAIRGVSAKPSGGDLTLQGPKSTDVSLQSRTIPGQSYAAERDMVKRDLFSQGPLTMQKLLDYKSQMNQLEDVPNRTVHDLKVKRTQGAPVKVKTADPASGAPGGRAPVASGKIIGTPYKGTHTLGNWQSDNAVDVSLKIGTPLRIPRDAVVEKVGGSYKGGASRFDGYQVTVRLPNGNRLFYTHLSKSNVRAGQRLRAGQVIGRSGAANGVPHLHLGAEHGNPGKFIK